MRKKEGSIDYKYFVEPNIPRIKIDSKWLEEIKSEIPTLPNERLKTYMEKYGLSEYDGKILVRNKDISDYFNKCLLLGINPKIANLTTLVNTDKALKTNLENMQTVLTTQKNNSTDQQLIATLTQQITMNTKTIALLEQNISANEQSIELLKSVGTAKATVTAIKEGLDGKGTKTEPGLKAGANSLDKNLTALANGLNTMNTKSDELVAGTSELSTKSAALINGINDLKTGANKLNAGTTALNASAKQLYSASTQLTEKSGDIADGAKQLSEGIEEFNTKAINKLYSTVNGDVRNLTSRIDALEKLSKQYMNFAEMDEKMNGNVKFILITDPLKQSEEKTNN